MPTIRAAADTFDDNKKRPQQQERKVPITRHSHNESSSSAAEPRARVEAHQLSAPGDPRALELLERIERHGFNASDDPLGFESRLADDHGWTLGYALAVVDEYRRFLVLTQVAGHTVSPSPDVDEAWHLHLTRTVHYGAFCADVFGRFLHHEPAKAGEDERHRDMYRETLAGYRRAFGSSAPSVIWPAPDKRGEQHASRPATWTVPHMLRGHRLAITGVLVAVAAGLLSRDLDLLAPLQDIPPSTFLLVALLATVAIGWLGLRDRMPSAGAVQRDMLEPYEAAWFSGGAERMAMTAVVMLTERGILLAPGKPSERGQRPPIPLNATIEARCDNPAELACLSAAADGGVRFTAACEAMRPLAGQVERRLVAAGIASDMGALPLRRAWALLALCVLQVVEFERIFHAFGSSNRIGFLVLLTLAGVVLAFVLARQARRANPRSERVLRPLRLMVGRYKKQAPVGEALAFGVALIGGTALAEDLRFDGMKQLVYAGGVSGRVPGKGIASGCSASSCSSCSACSGDGGGSSGCGGGSACSSGCGGGGGD